MFFVECGSNLISRQYGPFATIAIVNLWLESHAPTGSYLGLHSMCDDGVHRQNHKIYTLIDPIKGISRKAAVDVTHALTGE